MQAPVTDAPATVGRLLLVDDSPIVLRVTSDFLTAEGWEVLTARSGTAALARARTDRPDVVVCDLNMPDLSGVDVVHGLQEIDAAIPVIMLSGERNVGSVVEAVHAGVFDFITKGRDLRPLANAIRRAHEHVRVVRENQRLTSDLRRMNEDLERRVEARTTELSASLAELAASREQVRAIVETTRAVPWQMEPETWHFTYVGPQIVKLLGEPAERWLERGFLDDRIAAEDRAPALAAMRDVVADGGDREIEFRLRAASGVWVWIRSVVGTCAGPDGRALCGVLLDVTETKRLESELRQAQKLESVGRLAAGVAHEINTPVQFVHDSVHFVRESFDDLVRVLDSYRLLHPDVVAGRAASDTDRGLASVEEAADLPYVLEQLPEALGRASEGLLRISTIVRSLKEFAHPEQNQRSVIDLNRALETTLTIARSEYRLVADVVTDLGELAPVTCLPGEINQAFLNIIVNAAHAIGEVMQRTGERGTITVRTRQDGAETTITISDTGGGIPRHVRDRIFDPFFTTKEVGRGTGQGLAIARSVIVEKHGGHLDFETTDGAGTIFSIRLPTEGSPVAAIE